MSYSLGSLAASIQSIVYGGATGGLFSLLQSAGATIVLPSVGAMLTGAAATGAGVAVMKSDQPIVTGEIRSDRSSRGHRSGDANDDGDDSDPPPYRQTAPQEYLFTPLAVQAIAKSWDVTPYSPRWSDLADWLGKVDKLCEVYRVPLAQRALFGMYSMRSDCREVASAAGCHEMSWDQFTVWLHEHHGMCCLDDPVLVCTDVSIRREKKTKSEQ